MTAVEINIIGDDFKEGAKANVEIDCLLGFNSILLDDDKAIRSEKFECIETPNYCGDEELLKRLLDENGIKYQVFTSKHNYKRKKLENIPLNYVVTFNLASETYLTINFNTQEKALACALWYALFYLN